MTHIKHAQHPDEFWTLVADQFRVLSEPLRVRILYVLKSGEKSVGEVVEAVKAHQPTVSKQLKALHEAEFIARRQEGTTVFYRIEDPMVFQLCELVCSGLEARIRRTAAARLQLLGMRG